jgi:hypothetical protein
VRVPVRTAPAGDLAGRLVRAGQRAFVGRNGERELFAAALADEVPGFAVLFVHGPGGIGKTALLGRLVHDAEAAGAPTVRLDCRSLQPSPAGFLAALARALGLADDADPVPALHAAARPVLVLDTFERCSGLQGWLRTEFLPRLPGGALTVVAGREPPDSAWRLDPAWHGLLRTVALRNLPPEDAGTLLAGRGVGPGLRDRVLAVTGGHPLALCLIAELLTMREHPDDVPDVGSPDVVRVLLERFVDDVPSLRHRAALELCAHARVTTESLLRAVLDDDDPGELFDWLRSRSFVEVGSEGVHPHDVARDVLDAELRWRDPDRYRALHHRLREQVLRPMGEPGADQARCWQDLMFLHRRNPGMAPFLNWEIDSGVFEDELRPGDRPVVRALTTEAEGAESAAVCDYWLDRQPHGCRVYRRIGSTELAGFALWLRLAEPDAADHAIDPVVAAAWRHVAALAPLRPGEELDVLRTFVVPGAYHRPSPVMDLIQVRCARGWTTPPAPALSFVANADRAFWTPQMVYIDHPPVADVAVGGRVYTLFAHDWRAVPLADWLTLLGSRELATGAVLPPEPAPARTVLSAAEFETAARAALRSCRRPDELARNPLCRSRLVAEAPGDGPPAHALAELLVAATDSLAEDPRDEKLHRVVAATFFQGVPTQEAAADRLGLPFSTYRRHLAAGIGRVSAWLWARELHGVGRGHDAG